MEVYLFRHGEADAVGVEGDEARPLTADGRRDTLAIGEALLRTGVKPDAIWTSPLLRARQTGEILQGILAVSAQSDERLRPGATLGGVQALVSEHDYARLMLVGHEPDMSGLVYQLTGKRVKMQTSGVARVDLDRVEPGQGVLVWVTSPDRLSAPNANRR